MAPRGEADAYYNGEPQSQQQQYPMVPQQGYEQPAQPQYAQAPPNYDGEYNGSGTGQSPLIGGKNSYEQVFKIEKPKYNDLWAGILLIIVFAGFTAISGIALHSYATNKSFNGDGFTDGSNHFSLNTNTVLLFAFVLVVAFVLSWVYFTLARMFTKQFIWITGVLNIVFGLGTAIYYLIRHNYPAGVIFALFAVFSIFCFISWIPRIPFSVLMLQTAMDVAKGFGHVFLVSAIGGFIALVFGAWFSVSLVAVYIKWQPNPNGDNPGCSTSGGDCSYAKVVGILVFMTFAAYWISEWLKNTIHTTIAGVYGSWFFCSGKPGGMPSGATRGALKRSLTYSFGSISFGSLVVALINFLRQAVSVAQSSEAADGDTCASIAFCLLGCIISMLQWAVEFINRYAFSHIALYGKAYIPAAKDTWKMMKDRGIDALVNDCLVGPVLTMGATFVAFICTLLSFLYLEFTKPAYNSEGSYTVVIMAFSFLIGLQVCQTFMTPIGSGIDTFFVAAAWDPEVLMRDHPELYSRMIQVYPKVQQAIHA